MDDADVNEDCGLPDRCGIQDLWQPFDPGATAKVGPVAWSEGARMASLIHAGRSLLRAGWET